MPLYTYECQKCGHRFDSIEGFETRELPCKRKYADSPDEQPPPDVPVCDGTAKRIPSVASFKFNCSMPTYQRPKT